MIKLKTVEEVAVELNLKRLPASRAIHPREIRDAFIRDRHTIHTLLRESINEMLHREFMKDSPAKHQNDAFLKVLTLIDELFSDKS